MDPTSDITDVIASRAVDASTLGDDAQLILATAGMTPDGSRSPLRGRLWRCGFAPRGNANSTISRIGALELGDGTRGWPARHGIAGHGRTALTHPYVVNKGGRPDRRLWTTRAYVREKLVRSGSRAPRPRWKADDHQRLGIDPVKGTTRNVREDHIAIRVIAGELRPN